MPLDVNKNSREGFNLRVNFKASSNEKLNLRKKSRNPRVPWVASLCMTHRLRRMEFTRNSWKINPINLFLLSSVLFALLLCAIPELISHWCERLGTVYVPPSSPEHGSLPIAGNHDVNPQMTPFPLGLRRAKPQHTFFFHIIHHALGTQKSFGITFSASLSPCL